MSFRTLTQAVVGLCNSVLGDDVTYTPSGGSAVSIKGVFNNEGVEVENTIILQPVVRIVLADLLADPGKGDTVTIEGTTYRVMESRKDAYGGSTLILQES